MTFVSLIPTPGAQDPVDHEVASRVGARILRALGAIPITSTAGSVAVAVSDPGEAGNANLVGKVLGLRAWAVLADPGEIELAIGRVHPPGPAPVQSPLPDEGPVATSLPEPGSDGADGASVSRLGEALVTRGLIDREQLEEAVGLQERQGSRLGEVLAHGGYVSESDVARTLADLQSRTFTDPAGLEIDLEVARRIPESIARRRRAVPLAHRDGVLYVAMANALDADAIAEVERHASGPVRVLAAPANSIDALIQRAYAHEHSREAVERLARTRPEDSARRVISRGQRNFLIAAALFGALALIVAPLTALIVFNAAAITLYGAVIIHRFLLVYHSLDHEMELPVTDEEVAALDDRELPVYTILVPLYKEPQMLPHIVRSVAELDYPRAKLDVKILLEEDDVETLEALAKLDLPPHFRLVVIPDSMPKTKPKACNVGLLQARGELVVIYDAEDEPEPDQLKKAIVAFRKADPAVVCMQAKLNYFNQHQNLLTRWFTTEYSLWFDLLLPGLDAGDSPIPLGGTSNHFITESLLEVGAWDPYNVTEDADLGVRLHKLGYRTGVVDSTTFEEANSDLGNWIRQRSRWVKGYIQSYLVQMRHPIQLWRALGARGFFSFQLIVGGTAAVFLLNPFYWLLTTVWLLTESGTIESAFPSLLFYLGGIGFYVGNFLLAYMAAAASSRRRYYDLAKYSLLIPVYWLLMSVGAWKGMIQLIRKPFYWEKTVHGLHLQKDAGFELGSESGRPPG